MAGISRRELLVIALIGLFTAVAGVTTIQNGASFHTFLLSAAALAGLAWLVSFSTEQLGERLGPAATGMMQSTLGNLPEFFVVLFALRAGQSVVATTTIVGSIFANALLVLGLAIVAGAWRSKDGVMRFATRLPNDTATLTILATFIIVSIGLSVASNDNAADNAQEISIIGAVALIIVYLFWVWDYLRAGRGTVEPISHGQPRVSAAVACGLLALSGVGAAFVSDWFVQGLEPAIDKLGISQAFAGIVIVAIAGNAIENATGVMLAFKGQSDLAVSVIKNSVAQIAVFLFPALVLASLFLDTHLTFAMAPIWIGALALTAIIVWQVTGDGESPAWEGIALIMFYVILGGVAWYE